MKTFFSFLLGIFLPLIIGGAFFFWYILRDQKPAAPVQITGNAGSVAVSPAKKGNPWSVTGSWEVKAEPVSPTFSASAQPGAGDSSVVIEGYVAFPRVHYGFLSARKDALITISVFEESPDKSNARLTQLSEDFVLQRMPYLYKLPLSPKYVEAFRKNGGGTLYVGVSVCYGPPTQRVRPPSDIRPLCSPRTIPGLSGFTVAKVTLPADLKGAVSVPIPPIVVTYHNKEVDPAACAQSGGTISGWVQPTTAFLSNVQNAKRMILIARPRPTWRTLPEPFQSSDDFVKATVADLAKLEELGISRQALALRGGEPIPFSLKIPASARDVPYALVANLCKEGESDDDCTASAFPIPRYGGKNENVSRFRLVPIGFEAPRCGAKPNTYYLHQWPGSGVPPSDISVNSASPPELIEGANF